MRRATALATARPEAFSEGEPNELALGEFDAYNNLALMFLELEHDEDAEEAFKRGAAEGDALAARNYGEALLEWGRPEEAEIAFLLRCGFKELARTSRVCVKAAGSSSGRLSGMLFSPQ